MRRFLWFGMAITWAWAVSAQELSGEPDTVVPLPPVAQGTTSEIGRGPSGITQELARDEAALSRQADGDELSPLQRWYAFKDDLKTRHNLELGVAYTAAYQRASDDIVGGSKGVALLNDLFSYLYLSPIPATPTRDAAGGIFELQGTWTFVRPNTPNKGFIAFDIESRHQLGTDIPPQNLFLEAGAFWPTATGFGEFDLAVVALYYEQYFADGAVGIRIGKTLPFAIYDYLSLKNPKTDFLNASFTLNPAVSWASFGFGIAGIVRPIKPLYILAGIHDLNGGPEQGIETFFTDDEYFKAVEVGWDSKLSFGNGNIHALFWDTDARRSTQTPASRGVTIGGEQEFGRLLPFFRYGYADGAGAVLSHLVAGGLGIKDVFGRKTDIVGLGLSWGRPYLDELFVDQKAAELYYRFHLTDEIAITPSIQYIKDPPLNLDTDDLVLFSVRGRAAY